MIVTSDCMSGKKAKKEKQRRKKGRSATAAIIGIAGMAASLAGYCLYDRFRNIDEFSQPPAIVAKEVSSQDINNYILEKEEFVTDPGKRNIYIIYQKHAVEAEFLDRGIVQETIESSRECQVSIYRIIEHLYNNRGLRLIVNEGVFHDDFFDVDNPDIMKKAGLSSVTEKIEAGNDNILRALLSDYGGATLIGLLYNDLYITGYEEKGTAATNDMMRELFGVNKQGKIDPESMERMRELEEDIRKKRSMNALKYAIKHADELYEKGLIDNHDAAIVIGYGHKPDYRQTINVAKEGKTDFNLIIYTPKGIE